MFFKTSNSSVTAGAAAASVAAVASPVAFTETVELPLSVVLASIEVVEFVSTVVVIVGDVELLVFGAGVGFGGAPQNFFTMS